MATMVVLVEAEASGVSLDSRAISELARLGITNVSLVCDGDTIAVVLEGWAFVPAEVAEAARSAVAGKAAKARTLLPLGEMALAPPLFAPAAEPLCVRNERR